LRVDAACIDDAGIARLADLDGMKIPTWSYAHEAAARFAQGRHRQ